MDFAAEYYIGKLMLVVAKYRPNVAAHLYFLEDRTKLLALMAVELEARNVHAQRNLRFLEEKISELDHEIYQAGLSLGNDTLDRKPDRLGLRYSYRNVNIPALQDSITDSLVLNLRYILKDYAK
ncbi:MAG: hypothetical protein LQ349_000658 [Xanthoria aureola]|nr:MAG: hypothetical protein LQ349_000658 [Xanthoria aureola]